MHAPLDPRVIEALCIGPEDRLLEIGGDTRTLSHLAALAPRGRVIGVHASRRAVEAARGEMEMIAASAARLPFADAEFDAALSAHALYFWNDLGAAFREIARVLRPGGRLALLFRVHPDMRAFPAESRAFAAPGDVIGPLEGAGFAVMALDGGDGRIADTLLVAVKR